MMNQLKGKDKYRLALRRGLREPREFSEIIARKTKRTDISVRPPSAFRERLLFTEAFLALDYNDAISVLLKALHSGIRTGSRLDRFGLTITRKFDNVPFRRSLVGLGAVEILDLDRVLIAFLRDVQICSLNTRPSAREGIGFGSSGRNARAG